MSQPNSHSELLRIGAVNYLNSKPLVYGLTESSRGQARLLFDLPSRLADSLAAGRLDVALIPCVEFLSNPAYQLTSDACVASEGAVRSVKVYFRRPPKLTQRLALDEGSRTSAALAQVLLATRFDLRPELESLPIGQGVADAGADAVLMIGDRAMQPPPEPFAEVWDLGDEWHRWTGLPFVFACWAARPEVDTAPVASLLASARDAGEKHLTQIAEREAPTLGIPLTLAHDYLHHNLHYRLASKERRSLERFREECDRLQLLSPATV